MFPLLGLLLVVSLVQASIWPYHGSAPVTGAIINEYGPVAYGHASLAANPIVVPDITRAVIGPSEPSVVVQGPQQRDAAIIGPSGDAVLVQGSGKATIIGPRAPDATIIGPKAAGATIIGPSAADATIIGSKAVDATIIGPSVGGQFVVDGASAHAHAEAEAHAHAHAHANHNLIIQPPRQTVYVKEIIREPIVHTLHGAHGHRVVCAPPADGVSTSAAIEAIARAGSNYGPVHLGSALGRPVITVSGPPLVTLGRPGYVSSSSSSSSSSASASASASSSSNIATNKFWYPGPSWIKC